MRIPRISLSAQKKLRCKRVAYIVVAIALGLLGTGFILTVNFWPSFDGKFLNNAASQIITISTESGKVYVDESAGKDTGATKFEASEQFYSLKYGKDLDSRAVVFEPFPGRYYLISGCQKVSLEKQTWLTAAAKTHPYIVSSVALGIMLCVLFLILDQKARTDPKLIYWTWLAFFFALFVSAAILVIAGETKIFDYDGKPLNEVAKIILNVVDFVLDIERETLLLGVCLAVVALPQWFAYVMSGLNGAAQESRFVTDAWRVTAMLLAKSFISASAVAMSIDFIGSHYGWVSSEPQNIISKALIQIMLLFYGWFLLFSVPQRVDRSTKAGRSDQASSSRIHAWMTRRMGDKAKSSPSSAETSSSLLTRD